MVFLVNSMQPVLAKGQSVGTATQRVEVPGPVPLPASVPRVRTGTRELPSGKLRGHWKIAEEMEALVEVPAPPRGRRGVCAESQSPRV